MKYIPGRKHKVAGGKKGKVGGLREERISGIPHSFERLDSFLKDKRRDLKDYVRETCEIGAKDAGFEPGEGNAEDRELEVAEDVVGPDMELGDSDDEEEFSDASEEDIDSD